MGFAREYWKLSFGLSFDSQHKRGNGRDSKKLFQEKIKILFNHSVGGCETLKPAATESGGAVY